MIKSRISLGFGIKGGIGLMGGYGLGLGQVPFFLQFEGLQTLLFDLLLGSTLEPLPQHI